MLGKVEYLGALCSNYYSQPTYIVMMAAMVEQVLPFGVGRPGRGLGHVPWPHVPTVRTELLTT